MKKIYVTNVLAGSSMFTFSSSKQTINFMAQNSVCDFFRSNLYNKFDFCRNKNTGQIRSCEPHQLLIVIFVLTEKKK